MHDYQTEIPTLDTAGVAGLLAMTEREFIGKRPRLQQDHGFPRALPGCGRRWSRSAVLRWIDGWTNKPQAEPVPPAAPAGEKSDVVIELARRSLEARYRRSA